MAEKTADYKKALQEKEAKQRRLEEEKLQAEMEKKRGAVKARREAEAKKKELQEKRILDLIAKCDSEIEKAKRVLDGAQVHETIGKIALWISAIILIVTVLMAFTGLIAMESIIIPMLLSWAILGVSVFFQTRTMFAESKYRKNSSIRNKLRRELFEMKNRH